MIKTLLYIFIFLFTVTGICEFIYFLKMWFFYPNVRMRNYVLVTLNNGNAIKQLNYIWQKILWHGDSFAVGIIAIIDNLDNNEILSCNSFSEKKNIFLCSAASLNNCEQIQGEIIDGEF